MTAREKAVGILGGMKLRELEQARLMVVDCIEYEAKEEWIRYLKQQLEKCIGSIRMSGNQHQDKNSS